MTADAVLLTRNGRWLGVTGPAGAGGPTALPDRALHHLAEALTYYEKEFIHNADPDGELPFRFHQRLLYTLKTDPTRLFCPAGLRQRVTKTLRDAGYRVLLSEVDQVAPAALAQDWAGACRDYPLRPNQVEPVATMLSTDCGVFSAATGFGKTYTIKFLTRLLPKAKFHIAVKSSDIADAIYRDLLKGMPDVGRVGDGKRRFGRVTVINADSLHLGAGDADVLIGEEVHELAAAKYVGPLAAYARARAYGFSASVGCRGDGRDMEVEAAFGPVLYELTYQESEAVKDVVPIRVEWLRTPLRYDPAAGIRNATTRDQVGIWRNDARNKAIADRVRLLDPGRQVLIVVKTIDHAVHLKRHLPDFELVYANDSPATDPLAGYREQGLVGPAEPVMTTARRRALREDFRTGKVRRAVSTYVWATGVDFPKLDVLIRADAAGSATKDIQIPGRLSRNSAGKTEGLLIDLWDDYSQTYLRKAKGRRGRYGRRGFTQLEPGVLATPGGR